MHGESREHALAVAEADARDREASLAGRFSFAHARAAPGMHVDVAFDIQAGRVSERDFVFFAPASAALRAGCDVHAYPDFEFIPEDGASTGATLRISMRAPRSPGSYRLWYAAGSVPARGVSGPALEVHAAGLEEAQASAGKSHAHAGGIGEAKRATDRD